MRRLPPGFVEVEPGVFEGPSHKVGPDAFVGVCRVVLGAPDDEHSCDAMGCGSLDEHVVSREVRPWRSRPSTAEEYIARGEAEAEARAGARCTVCGVARNRHHEADIGEAHAWEPGL